jgi:hypothetical protein
VIVTAQSHRSHAAHTGARSAARVNRTAHGFANPAISTGRTFSDTIAAIAPASVPAFTLATSPAA